MAIDRARIVDEALALLNEVGMDKLTTRKLAERLRVQQPALYWHFANKSALLDAINSAMLQRYHTHRVPGPDENWVDFTFATARDWRRAQGHRSMILPTPNVSSGFMLPQDFRRRKRCRSRFL